MSEHLNLNEVARLLQLDVKTLRQKCEAGAIPSERVAGEWMIPASAMKDISKQFGSPFEDFANVDELSAMEDERGDASPSTPMEISTMNIEGGLPEMFGGEELVDAPPRAEDELPGMPGAGSSSNFFDDELFGELPEPSTTSHDEFEAPIEIDNSQLDLEDDPILSEAGRMDPEKSPSPFDFPEDSDANLNINPQDLVAGPPSLPTRPAEGSSAEFDPFLSLHEPPKIQTTPASAGGFGDLDSVEQPAIPLKPPSSIDFQPPSFDPTEGEVPSDIDMLDKERDIDLPPDAEPAVLGNELDMPGLDDPSAMHTMMGNLAAEMQASGEIVEMSFGDDVGGDVLSGNLDAPAGGEDMRTVMGSAAQLGGGEKVDISFGGPEDLSGGDVLSGHLDAPAGGGEEMHTVMGSAAHLPGGEQVDISFGGADDQSSDVFSGEFAAPAAGEDMRTMMGSAAQLAGGEQVDISFGGPEELGGGDVLGGNLDAPAGGEDMRTMMGSAAQLAGGEKVDISFGGPEDLSGGDVLGANLDAPAGGEMHTMMGSAAELTASEDPVDISFKSSSTDIPGGDVLAGQLEALTSGSGEMRTVTGSAAELTSGEQVDLSFGGADDLGGDVLGGNLDAPAGGEDMRTMMGSAAQLAGGEQVDISFGGPEDLSGGADVLGEHLDAPAGGEMHTVMGSAADLTASEDPVDISFKSSSTNIPGGDVLAGQLEAIASSGEMRTVMGSADDLPSEASEPIDITLASGSSVDVPGGDMSGGAVLEGDLDAGPGGEMRTVMGSADDLSEPVDISLTGGAGSSVDLDGGGAVLEGDLDAPAGGEMHTVMGSASEYAVGDHEPVDISMSGGGSSVDLVGSAAAQSESADVQDIGDDQVDLGAASDDDAAVLAGDLDVIESGEMGTVMGSASNVGASDDEIDVSVAGSRIGAGSDAILRGDADLPSQGRSDQVDLSFADDGDAAVLGDELEGIGEQEMGTVMGSSRAVAAGDEAVEVSSMDDEIDLGGNLSGTSLTDSGRFPHPTESLSDVLADAEVEDTSAMHTMQGSVDQLVDENAKIILSTTAPVVETNDDEEDVFSGELGYDDSGAGTMMGQRAEFGLDNEVKVTADDEEVDLEGADDDLEGIFDDDMGLVGRVPGASKTQVGIRNPDLGDTVPLEMHDDDNDEDQEVLSVTDDSGSGSDYNAASRTVIGISPLMDAADQVHLSTHEERAMDSDIRLAAAGQADESDVRLVHDPGLVDSNIEMASTQESDDSSLRTVPFGSDESGDRLGPVAGRREGRLPGSSDEEEHESTMAVGGSSESESEMSIDLESPDTDMTLSPDAEDVDLVAGSGIGFDDTMELSSIKATNEEGEELGFEDSNFQETVTLDEPITLPFDSGILNESPSGSASDFEPAGSSVMALSADTDDDFVLGGEGGSDVTLNPSASGIGITGSGFGLGEVSGSGLELGSSASSTPALDGDTDFLLAPHEDDAGGGDDSGSQVIALEPDADLNEAAATMLGGESSGSGGPMLGAEELPGMGDSPSSLGGSALGISASSVGFGAMPSAPMGAMPSGAMASGFPGMMGAAPSGPYASSPTFQSGVYTQPGYGPAVITVTELPYTVPQVVALGFATVILLLSGMMMFDLTVANLWDWQGTSDWTKAIMDPIVENLGG